MLRLGNSETRLVLLLQLIRLVQATAKISRSGYGLLLFGHGLDQASTLLSKLGFHQGQLRLDILQTVRFPDELASDLPGVRLSTYVARRRLQGNASKNRETRAS